MQGKADPNDVGRLLPCCERFGKIPLMERHRAGKMGEGSRGDSEGFVRKVHAAVTRDLGSPECLGRGGRVAAGEIEEPERPRRLFPQNLVQVPVGAAMEEIVVIDHLPIDAPLLLEDRGAGLPLGGLNRRTTETLLISTIHEFAGFISLASQRRRPGPGWGTPTGSKESNTWGMLLKH